MSEKKGFLDKLYDGLGSLKLSVFIFLTLAALSVIGTLLPQNLTHEQIHARYNEGTAKVVEFLGLNDVYHAPWFQFLLILLGVNLIVCTLQRLPKTIKLLRHKDERIDPHKLAKFGCSAQLTAKVPFDQAVASISEVVTKEFGALKRIETPSGTFGAVAEKARWSPLMVYVVHVSVLVVLIGALMGSLFGFKGFMQIAEGQDADEVNLTSGGPSHLLPFRVRCDDFDVSYYDNGMPKEFRSDLVIIEGDKEVLKQTIRVNDPLTYRGVTFYQSSYGSTLKEAEVELTNKDSGKTHRMTLRYRDTTQIPDSEDAIQIAEYQENLRGFGPALGIVVARPGQNSVGAWIVSNVPDFHGNKIHNYQIKVLNISNTQFTGLQVKEDPGVWVVWVGFTAMMVGIGLAFYTSHRRVWIWAEAEPSGKGSTRVVLAGRAAKSSLAFEDEFNRLNERLSSELKA